MDRQCKVCKRMRECKVCKRLRESVKCVREGRCKRWRV